MITEFKTMQIHPAMKPFVERPWLSALLAVLMLLLGLLFVNGGIPRSPNRWYVPGHEWIMASVSWGLALFWGSCARLGFSATDSRPKKTD